MWTRSLGLSHLLYSFKFVHFLLLLVVEFFKFVSSKPKKVLVEYRCEYADACIGIYAPRRARTKCIILTILLQDDILQDTGNALISDRIHVDQLLQLLNFPLFVHCRILTPHFQVIILICILM